MAQLNFDATNVKPSAPMEPVPTGFYKVMIDESGMKPTKLRDGEYLQLRFNIIEGQFANRKIFARLNLANKNPVAVEIAQADLSAICHAVKLLQVADSTQLHAKPLLIKVALVPADSKYGASNDIKGYYDINDPIQAESAANGVSGNSAPPATAAAAPAQAWQQPTGGAWGAPAEAQAPAAAAPAPAEATPTPAPAPAPAAAQEPAVAVAEQPAAQGAAQVDPSKPAWAQGAVE